VLFVDADVEAPLREFLERLFKMRSFDHRGANETVSGWEVIISTVKEPK
jgi:hypothetical protein